MRINAELETEWLTNQPGNTVAGTLQLRAVQELWMIRGKQPTSLPAFPAAKTGSVGGMFPEKDESSKVECDPLASYFFLAAAIFFFLIFADFFFALACAFWR